MLKFQLERKYTKEGYTIGNLFYDNGEGWKYLCNILEDTVRDKDKNGVNEEKIYGQTAIPYGTYSISITYSAKFKRDLPLLNGVNGFTGIRIHPGNTVNDTEGCLLPGVNDVKGQVHQSTIMFNKIWDLMQASKQSEWIIEII